MKTVALNALMLLFLSGCAISISHPEKGTSIFNGHQETEEMSSALKMDLRQCREFAEKMMVKSGLKIYRLPHSAVKQCLRNKGWEFHP